MAESQLGGLPNGWAWSTIGEITEVVEKVEPADNPDSQFVYLDISSIDNTVNAVTQPKIYRGADAPSRARQLVYSGDVLFSTVRTYLKNIALVPDRYDGEVASTGFSILRGTDGIPGKYLFYFTLTDDFIATVTALQRGVSYPAVRDSDVRAQQIPLAPVPEQHRIVAEIETQFTRLEAGVAALKRAQANLRRYKAAVLKAACEGRLVPTEAELARAEGRDYEPADVLLQRILAERRARWEAEKPGKRYEDPMGPDTTGLPVLPEGWTWATFEHAIASFRSGSSTVPQDEPTPFPILRSSSVRPNRIDYADIRYLTEQDSVDERNYLKVGNLLFTRLSGSLDYVGNCALVRNPEAVKVQYPDRIFCAELVMQVMGTYLEVWFSTPNARNHITAMAKSTAGHQRISMGAIRQQVFPLPPQAEQQRIVGDVEQKLSVVLELEKQVETALQRAERLRQAILKRAFEGKLVPQDPDDEPALVLLERIQAEKPRDHKGRNPNQQAGTPHQPHLCRGEASQVNTYAGESPATEVRLRPGKRSTGDASPLQDST